MNYILDLIEKKYLKKISTASNITNKRPSQFLYVNDKEKIFYVYFSRSPLTFYRTYRRYMRMPVNTHVPVGVLYFKDIVTGTGSENWTVYQTQVGFGLLNIEAIAEELGYTQIERKIRYTPASDKKEAGALFSAFLIETPDSPLRRWTISDVSMDEKYIIQKAILPLSYQTSSSGIRSAVKICPNYLDYRERFLGSLNKTVRKVDIPELTVETDPRKYGCITRELNKQEIINCSKLK